MTPDRTDHYRLNTNNLSRGECWRPGGVGRRRWFWLRVWLRLTEFHPLATTCCPADWPAVAEADLPAAVAARLAPHRELLVRDGFAVTHAGRMPVLAPRYQQEHALLLLSADGAVGAIVTDTRREADAWADRTCPPEEV